MSLGFYLDETEFVYYEREIKMKVYMSVGVIKDYELKLRNHKSLHWFGLGTGTPKDRDEVNRREVFECDG